MSNTTQSYEGVRELTFDELNAVSGGCGAVCDWVYDKAEAAGEWVRGLFEEQEEIQEPPEGLRP